MTKAASKQVRHVEDEANVLGPVEVTADSTINCSQLSRPLPTTQSQKRLRDQQTPQVGHATTVTSKTPNTVPVGSRAARILAKKSTIDPPRTTHVDSMVQNAKLFAQNVPSVHAEPANIAHARIETMQQPSKRASTQPIATENNEAESSELLPLPLRAPTLNILDEQRDSPLATPVNDITQTVGARIQISGLHNVSSSSWTLFGWVIWRGSIRYYNVCRGNGKLLDFYIMDSAGDTVRATLFDKGVDTFDVVIRSGSFCSFCAGKIKKANPVFTEDPFELTLNELSVIKIVTEAIPVPPRHSSLLKLSDIKSVAISASFTTIGIVVRCDPSKSIRTKKGTSVWKRDILIVDDSKTKAVCTLWGSVAQAEPTSYQTHPILIKNAKTSDYEGIRSINAGLSTTILFDPDCQDAKRLTAWFAEEPDYEVFPFSQCSL